MAGIGPAGRTAATTGFQQMIRRADLGLIGLRDRERAPVPRPRIRLVASDDSVRLSEALARRFPPWSADRRDSLRLGLTCPINAGAPHRLVAAFHTGHPQVDLVVEDLGEADLAKALESRRIDVALALETIGDPSWCRLPLWRERLCAVVADTHCLAGRAEITRSELRGQSILLAAAGASGDAMEAAITAALDGAPAAFIHCAVQRDTLLDLVALDAGIALVGADSLGAPPPGISVIPLENAAPPLSYAAVWLPDNRKAALNAFIDESYAASDQAAERPRGGVS
jgi:DNA-binding transcriptional LysR family regulator